MYSIAEQKAQVGQTTSRENSRLWLREDGETTPSSEEAAQYEYMAAAEKAAGAAGITLGKDDSWWVIVDLDKEDERD